MEELKNEEMNNEEPEEIKEATDTEEPTEVEEIQTAEKSSDSKEETETEEQKKKEKPKRIEKISEKIKIFEPFLRLIEVAFIGVLSVAIAINANIIADRANEIANSQLEIERMEKTPHFSLYRQLLPNDADEVHATEEIILKLDSGIAYNIRVDVETTFTFYSEKTFVENNKYLLFDIEDYFIKKQNENNSDIIVELSRSNNFKQVVDTFQDVMFESDLNFDSNYFCLNTYISILYNDFIGKEHSEYFWVHNDGLNFDKLVDMVHMYGKDGEDYLNEHRHGVDPAHTVFLTTSINDYTLVTIERVLNSLINP